MEEFEPFRLTKINSKGPEWVERREDRRLGDPNSLLGYDLLMSDALTKKQGRIYELAKERDEMFLPPFLLEPEKARVKHTLMLILREDPESFVRLTLMHLMTPENGERWAKALGVSAQGGVLAAFPIAAALRKEPKLLERLSMDDLLPLLEEHAIYVLDKQREFDRYFTDFKKTFAEKLAAKIQKGVIPLDLAQAQERLAHIRMTVIDPLNAKVNEVWGDYDVTSHTARVVANIPDKEWEYTMTHELFHALSGQSEAVADDFDGVRRGGLGLLSGKVDMVWLNEAVTEQLTLDFMRKKKSTVYVTYRKLLAKLVEAGVPRDVCYRAYFENYEITALGQHRTPALRELFQRADQATQYEGSGFLVDLSTLIHAHSPEEALKLWNQHLDVFPEFLRDWTKKYREARAGFKEGISIDDPQAELLIELTQAAGGAERFWRNFMGALPKRAVKIFNDLGIKSMEQLLDHTEEELAKAPGLGERLINTILLKLAELGLDLKRDA